MATTQKKQQRRSGGNATGSRGNNRSRPKTTNRETQAVNQGITGLSVMQKYEASQDLIAGYLTSHRGENLESASLMQFCIWSRQYAQQNATRSQQRNATGNQRHRQQQRRGTAETIEEQPQVATGKARSAAA